MKVSIIGAGLIGKRRAQIAKEYGDTVACVFDTDSNRATELAKSAGAKVSATADEAIEQADIVVIATPNKFLLPTARTALQAGKHVLIEKPMGRNLAEAGELAKLQKQNPTLVLKTGFNHRYHPAIHKAHELVKIGTIGEIMFIRATYGHGGRPGYEKEWRGNMDLAGGGELTDQGVHLIDLVCWMATPPDWVFAQKQQYFWPLQNGMEDNGFLTLGWNDGKLAQLHTSWTQWKNRFSFHIYGTAGAIEIEGLGGSYGPETLVIITRKNDGSVPEINKTNFPEKDVSWKEEWKDFQDAITYGSTPMGSTTDGLNAMRTLDAVYKSCKSSLQTHIIRS